MSVRFIFTVLIALPFFTAVALSALLMACGLSLGYSADQVEAVITALFSNALGRILMLLIQAAYLRWGVQRWLRSGTLFAVEPP